MRNKKIIFFFVLFFFFSFLSIKVNKFFKKTNFFRLKLENHSQTSQQNVLSSSHRAPKIYISGSDQEYSIGGVVALASTDEPVIEISGYDILGTAEISLYQTNEDALLNYLLHDKDGKQFKKTPDEDKMRFITTVKKDINRDNNESSKITLPLEDKGIWYLKVKLGSANADAFIVRSNIGILAKEGDNEFIFWGQNFKTKKSIRGGMIILYNLLDRRKELGKFPFNEEGIAKAPLTEEADIGLFSLEDERVIVPLNLRYLNTSGYDSYRFFHEKVRRTKYFIFTDRPLYRPGDTVYFKAILRNDDDARYTIPKGETLVKIYKGYYYDGSNEQPDFEKIFSISSDGTINGAYQIPADAQAGQYTLVVNIPNQSNRSYWDGEYSRNTINFDVEFFRKPEFSIEVVTSKTELIAGDKTSFKIKGTYFSGQPLANQKVKYTVYSSDFYEYQFLADQKTFTKTKSADYLYGYGRGNYKVTQGRAILNQKGEAVIDLETKIPFAKGKNQVFSIEATIDDASQNPSFSRKNLLVYSGEYGIYRQDYSYGSKVNTPLSLPVVLVNRITAGNVSNIKLTAIVHRESWIIYQEENNKYPSYRKEEEELPQLTTTTDSQGNAFFTFTPTKTGLYTITVEGKDSRNNTISKVFYSYISSKDYPHYSKYKETDLTVATDKQKYEPTDTVRLDIYSYIPDRDVFLSLERGRVHRFQIIHLAGKTASVEIPLVEIDIPNIYAHLSSFDDNSLNDTQANIPVFSESKRVIVNVTADSKTYGPGETATVNIQTTDINGNPVSADVTLWLVDKAIFELSDNRLGNIFNTFWGERYNNTEQTHSLEGISVHIGFSGGCFVSGTKVLMADGRFKNIEGIKIGDYILTKTSAKDSKLVKAKVTKTHSTQESGYLIINGNLKVTANHLIWVNNSWKQAGSIQIGDILTNDRNNPIVVKSVEWQRDKVNVYNLEIEKYRTYFANGIWVHNQKAEGARNVFKDTAYWNSSIHTDNLGRAQVRFKLPDNLTTWAIAVVASTVDTKVGQATNEIVVTKNIIVRPILPNVLRVGDQVILSALVQNFTNSDYTFDVELKFDSGKVEQSLYPKVLIKSNDMKQFYWKVIPTKENSKSKLIFSAKAKENNKLVDIVTQEIPVRSFVFEEKKAETGVDNKTFKIKLTPDIDEEKSKITLSLTPTIIGTLPKAMKYLIDYPYGCVEQTTSRFVPAVIAKVNSGLFAGALADKDIDNIIQKGVNKLISLQHEDGGWSWWFSGKSDPFITAYVVEYLLQAKQVGIKIDDVVLKQAQSYLEQEKYYDPKSRKEKTFKNEDVIAKTYALTLLGAKDKIKKLTNFENLSPDILSLAVMANYLNGDTNPQTNGLAKLVGMVQWQGDGVFWEGGNKVNFGSRDASTALAIRAIVLAGGDRNIAVKGARYLTRVRKYDYWSNTYATAQVIRALVELSKTDSELTPNYSYTVALDGVQITQGTVTNSSQTIKDIFIPVSKIRKDGSILSITKIGDGHIYSTLLIDEFHTDKTATSVNHGLSIRREYVSEKGEEYPLKVGDVVIVKLTVGGLKADENYGVINDELPSGLVPINHSFKNEQYYQDLYSYDITDKDITENGVVLSLYQIASGERTYTYKARVISEGTFLVPPATASLMYIPEVYGRSEAQIVKVGERSEITSGKTLKQPVSKYAGDKNRIIKIILLLILVGVTIITLKRKWNNIAMIKDKSGKTLKKDNVSPQNSTPPINSELS